MKCKIRHFVEHFGNAVIKYTALDGFMEIEIL
jgi:hypothetical protein